MTAEESSQLKRRLRVLLISLAVSLVIMAAKWWAYFISNSVALKTDALESFINIVAITMAIVAVYQAQRPADWNHPYGHGKIEFFSSAIEGGMLFLGSGYLLYEALQGIFANAPLGNFNQALIFSGAAGAMDGVLGYWQLGRGKILQSEAIITDARHLLFDFYTTLGIVVGLLLARNTGLAVLDPILGAAVALILLRNSLKIIRRSAHVLSDVEDPTLINKIVELMNSPVKPADIIDIHHLRSFRVGAKNFIDLHVVVPEFWNVREAHDEAEKFCADMQTALQRDAEFHPHVEPCMRKYCAHCEVEDCPVRQATFEGKRRFNTAEVIASREED